MAIDYTNLNGSVNIGESPAGKRDTWNSYNFFHTAFYQRVVLLCGGNLTAAERWWKTPLPYPPFLKDGAIRAPEELLTDEEWRSLRNWLGENVTGGWIDDVDFYNESQGIGTMTKQDNSLIQLVQADTGSTATTIQSRDGDYVIHTFTQSDQLFVRHEGIVEYFMVGGGGAGGGNYAGGGGGGGSVLTGFKRLTVGTYDIIIGAGGAGGLDTGTSGLQGQAGKRDGKAGGNTTAFGITAYGGGAGAGTTMNTFAAVATVQGAPQATPFTVDNSYAIGSGGGGSAANNAGAVSTSHTKGSNGFGYKGGIGFADYATNAGYVTSLIMGAGGGGAGDAGLDANIWTLNSVEVQAGSATSTTNSATAASQTLTATTASGTIVVGQLIYGSTAIPAGTYVQSISGTTLTLSTLTTAAITNASLTFGAIFSCASTPYLQNGITVLITGTNSGSAAITGYATSNAYLVGTCTNGTFTLTKNDGTVVLATTGTLTGLTFKTTTKQAGAGGIGVSSTISDNLVYYGGGGAGGVHGIENLGNSGGRGGGASSKNTNLASGTTNNGTANTGGGGAGASGLTSVIDAPGGTGGSGIVIIRYPKNAAFGKKKPGNVAAFEQQLSG